MNRDIQLDEVEVEGQHLIARERAKANFRLLFEDEYELDGDDLRYAVSCAMLGWAYGFVAGSHLAGAWAKNPPTTERSSDEFGH